jgi:predicted nucleotidyltransferase component of viral defense system
MHEQTLAAETRALLEKIAERPFLKEFYLAGGTSLALQFGHRISVDLDFFSSSDFSLPELKEILPEIGKYELTNEEPGTLDGILDEVKLTFLRYPYPLLFPLIEYKGIRMADLRDIAPMKLSAISSRGSRKDFIDLYFLLEKYHLTELVDLFEKKYAGVTYNKLHLLKSLTYFTDAEDEPMPRMLASASWEVMKARIVSEAKSLAI